VVADVVAAVAPGDHVCLPYRDGAEADPVVAAFLAAGLASRERCLLIAPPDRSDAVLGQMRRNGLPVADLTARGALVLADVDAFYRPTGRHNPQVALAAVQQVAVQARADGYAGLRGAGGPVAWSCCDREERHDLINYELRVNSVLREHAVTAMCLYDEPNTGAGPLDGMLRTHPRVIVDGRLRDNPFCELGPDEDAGDAPARVDWMLRALRQGRAQREQADDLESRRLTGELMRLREREAVRAEEVDSRNAFLRAFARQLGHPLAMLSATLAESSPYWRGNPPHHGTHGTHTNHDWLDRVREAVEGLTRLARHLDAASSHLASPANLALDEVDLADAAQAAVERWRSDHQRSQTDVRLTAAAPVHGLWDTKRLQVVIACVLDATWERGWGTRIDLNVEDLGPKGRLTAVYEDMEVMAGSPFDRGASEAVLAATRDSLRVALWVARENARFMGGALGLSVWPDARVSVTLDLPKLYANG
jgi:hypothetical protein